MATINEEVNSYKHRAEISQKNVKEMEAKYRQLKQNQTKQQEEVERYREAYEELKEKQEKMVSNYEDKI